MKVLLPLAVAVLVLGAAFYLLRTPRVAPRAEWKVGGLYATPAEKGGLSIVKILAMDEEAVHVRVYKEKFPSLPKNIDPSVLTLGSINDPDGFGMGHLPITPETFATWKPVFLRQTQVREEELEGYKMYKESGGKPWQ